MENYCDAGNASAAGNNASDLLSHLAGNLSRAELSSGASVFAHPAHARHAQHAYSELRNQPNTALMSLILALGTFLIAYFLRVFRNSKFLGRSVSFGFLSLTLKFSHHTVMILYHLCKLRPCS